MFAHFIHSPTRLRLITDACLAALITFLFPHRCICGVARTPALFSALGRHVAKSRRVLGFICIHSNKYTVSSGVLLADSGIVLHEPLCTNASNILPAESQQPQKSAAMSLLSISSHYGIDWSFSTIAILVAVAWSLKSIASRLWYYHRLSHFGGPLLAGFSRLWLVQTVWSGKAYLSFWEVTKKHGELRPICCTSLLMFVLFVFVCLVSPPTSS